jgi:potassium efflux system protein
MSMSGRSLLSSALALLRVVTLWLVAAAPAWAQEAVPTAVPPVPAQGAAATLEQLRAGRQAAEADATLDEAVKHRVLELYDQAMESRRLEAEVQGRLEALRARVQAAPARLEALAARPREPAEPETIPDDLSQVEQHLRQVEAGLAGAREALKAQEQELTGLLDANRVLGEGIVDRRRRLERISQDLNAPAPLDEPAALGAARVAALQARAGLRRTEVALFEARLENLDLLIRLATAERDALAERVARLEPIQRALAERAQALREARAAQSRREAERVQAEAAALPAALRAVAEQTVALSTEHERVTRQEKAANRRLAETQARLEEMRAEYERIRQRLDLVGPTEAMARLLRRRKAAMPSLRIYRSAYSERREEVATATNRQIDLDEARREQGALEAAAEALVDEVDAHMAAERRERLRARARELLENRREAMAELHKAYGRLVGALSALDLAERELLAVGEQLIAYIDGQLMWMRSVPAVGLADLAGTPTAIAWLASPENWVAFGGDLLDAAAQAPGPTLLTLLALVALVAARRRAVAALAAIAQRTRKIRTDAFALTLQALFWTVVLVLPGPLLLALLGWLPGRLASPAPFTAAAARGFVVTASLAVTLSVFRHLCRADGLADRHFRWPADLRRALVRQVTWLVWMAAPLAFVGAVTTESALPVPVQGLGRPAFAGAMLVLALFVYRLFRADGALMRTLAGEDDRGWVANLHFLWFPPLVALPLALAGLSLLGYHYTAIQLVRRVQGTVWLLIGLLLLRALLMRWLYVADRWLRFQEALRRREELRAQRQRQAQEEGERQLPSVEEPEVDYGELSDQTRRLLRAGVLFAAILGVWAVWADVLPALNFLQAVQLPFTAGEVVVDGVAKEVPVTLADALVGLVVIAITVLAAKNLPGLLEMTVLQRLPMDPGGRYATTTLSQYAIVAIGIIAGFGAVGAEWSSIQWLVAALGVGLGFGLQEIVANFISGLILLFERPIRVGDIVTVGDTSGVVSKIRIRATTIINWDKQELLVPNKEFITGRLLNWTLTDAINRVMIKVGVAHGSDIPRALALLAEAAEENEEVLADPAPIITFEGFSGGALDLVLRCYLPSMEHRLATISQLHEAINAKFAAAGITIAYPQRDVHMDARGPLAVRLVPEGPPARAE